MGTAAGVFWVPYYVPPLRVMPSVSQVFHFNNQVAIAILLAGTALTTWWSWLEARAVRSGNPPPDSPAAMDATGQTLVFPSDQQLGWWPLLVALAASGLELLLVFLASGWFPQGGASYFVNRLFFVQDGLRPYQDFEFSYGPTMLYVPVVVRYVTGISIHAAYLVTLWIFAWGGLILLWWVVRQAQARESGGGLGPAKTTAFLLVAAFPALNPESGLQYTMTRFICGFVALLAARIAVEKLAGRWFQVAICHLLLGAAVLSISPEIGLAFFAGLATYWFVEYQAGSKWLAHTAAVHLVLLGCLVILAPGTVFLSIQVFASGGSNFPLFPSLYLLLYVGSLLLLFPPLLARAIQAKPACRFGVFGTLTPAFAVHALVLMPAALGRADSGHVLYNGTGVFLLALLSPLALRPPSGQSQPLASVAFVRRWAYPALFALIFPVMTLSISRTKDLAIFWDLAKLQVVAWSADHPSSALARGVEKTLGEVEWNQRRRMVEDIRRNNLERWFPDLRRFGEICVPFGDSDVYLVLARHNALQVDYYYGITDESPVAEIHRKIADMRACTYAIVRGYALGDKPRVSPLDLNYYRRLLLFPVRGEPKIPPPPPAFEFLDYVRTSFVPLGQVMPGQYLCKRRPASR